MQLDKANRFGANSDDEEEEGDEADKAPEIDKEVVAAPVDNLDDGGDQWQHDDLS